MFLNCQDGGLRDKLVSHPVDHFAEHVVVHVRAGDHFDQLNRGLPSRAVVLDADQLDGVGVRGVQLDEDVVAAPEALGPKLSFGNRSRATEATGHLGHGRNLAPDGLGNIDVCVEDR